MKTSLIALAWLFLIPSLYPTKYAMSPPPEDTIYKIQDFHRAHCFSLFVGHGGPDASKHVAENLKDIGKKLFTSPIKDTLIEEFKETDEGLREVDSGTDAMIAFVNENNKELTIAHVGSCRAVASTEGKAIQLSKDHTPSNEEEINRINDAGGHIAFGKIMGTLDSTRSLGDCEHKWAKDKDHTEENYLISPIPEIEQCKLSNIEFFVLASKNVWDAIGNQEAINSLRASLRKGEGVKSVVDNFTSDLGMHENPAIMLIVIGDHDDWEDSTENKKGCCAVV